MKLCQRMLWTEMCVEIYFSTFKELWERLCVCMYALSNVFKLACEVSAVHVCYTRKCVCPLPREIVSKNRCIFSHILINFCCCKKCVYFIETYETCNQTRPFLFVLFTFTYLYFLQCNQCNMHSICFVWPEMYMPAICFLFLWSGLFNKHVYL